MAKKTTNPFQSPLVGDDSFSQDKIMKRNELINKYWIDPNNYPSPKKIAGFLRAGNKGWSNVHVEIMISYVENNIEDYYIGVFGDRPETSAETKERLRSIVVKWLRDYEDFLRKLMFYKSSMGKAQVQEILKRKWLVWDGYPESTTEFKKAIKAERAQFEKD